MGNRKTGKGKIGHLLGGIFKGIILLILIVVVGFAAMYQGQIRSICSLRKSSDDKIYEMSYKGNYHFDEFLKHGASSDREMAEFAASKIILSGMGQVDLPQFGCSTFNAQLENKDYIFGRNFDYSKTMPMVLHTKPKGGYESISMVDLKNLGVNERKTPESNMVSKVTTLIAPYVPMDGMNEKGVSVAVLQLSILPTNQMTDKSDITTTTAIRLVLDHAATVDEAVELLKQYDMHSSIRSCFHFQIADATGKSVIVEYNNNEMKVVTMEENYQVCTNFMISDLKENEKPSCDRYNKLSEILSTESGILTDEEAGMALLEGVYHKTQWSCIYNNTALTLTLCLEGDYSKSYTFNVKQ